MSKQNIKKTRSKPDNQKASNEKEGEKVKEKEKKELSKENGNSRKEAVAELAAALFLLEWTNTALDVYMKQLKTNYLKPLKEHVTKLKDDEDKKEENQSMVARLREAAENLDDWDGSSRRNMNTRKMVTVGEAAVMYRLRVIIEICTKLLDILKRLIEWNNQNINIMGKHVRKLRLLPYANSMIEGTAAIGEIFKLESINIDAAKAEYRKYLREPRKDDYRRTGTETERLRILSAEEYTPQLETQINHFRTTAYLVGNSLISILKVLTRVLTRDIIHIESSEVVHILHGLPPMYLRVDPFPLSSYNETLLSKTPPNTHQFALAPRAKSERTQKSGKSLSRKMMSNKNQKSSKRNGSKSSKTVAHKAAFINPIPTQQKATNQTSTKKPKTSIGKRLMNKLSRNKSKTSKKKSPQKSQKSSKGGKSLSERSAKVQQKEKAGAETGESSKKKAHSQKK